jgi:glycerophosphoryl diester phosphodiesterase
VNVFATSRARHHQDAAVLVGHRGGRGATWPPENTLAAFARAHADGARAVELDVRTCAGGHVVVMHDADLTRMTRGRDRRAVAALTLGELGGVALGEQSASERAPSLDDLLAWARGRVALNVEAKHDVPDRRALARGIAEALARHPDVEVLLSSFDPALLVLLAALAPRTPRAWLTHEGQPLWDAPWAPLLARAPVYAVHLERTQASPHTVAALKRAGKRVGVWTVNDPNEARDLAHLGVDWLISDDVAAIAPALSRAQSQLTGTVAIDSGGG